MLFCDDDTCRYCDGSGCHKEDVTMEVVPVGIAAGKQVAYNVCTDYRRRDNAGTD